jgi:hypothetical protein
MAMDYYDLGNTDKYFLALGNSNQWLKGKSSTGYEPYYTDIMGFWPDLYRNSFTVSYTYTPADEAKAIPEKEEYKTDWLIGWNMDMLNYPEELPFWLEFIDYGEIFDKFNISKIGRRSLVKNDSKVKMVLDPVIPPLLLYYDNNSPEHPEYTSIKADTIKYCIGTAPYPKSAQSVMDYELSQGTVYARSLNLSMVPNYSYDVNKTIKINNDKSQINGEFVVSRLSYPLNFNGMMSLQANELSQGLL